MRIITALWGNKYNENDVKKLPIDICFSDRKIDGIETRSIDMSFHSTWKKMTLFDKRLGLGECLFLDLDNIVQGNLNKFIDYYQQNKVSGQITLARVHWYDNKHMTNVKDSYISCNINSGVFAFDNDSCDHIYQEVLKNKNKLEMLFEGTDKWMYHRHKEYYNFWPDSFVQHETLEYEQFKKEDAIIISRNTCARNRNKIS